MKPFQKLSLNKETLQSLTPNESGQVGGGDRSFLGCNGSFACPSKQGDVCTVITILTSFNNFC